MSGTDTEGFAGVILDRAGAAVPSVVHYDADDSGMLFLRVNVGEDHSVLGLETVVTALRREGEWSVRQDHVFAHGELNGIVRTFDGGLEIRFPYRNSLGPHGGARAADRRASLPLRRRWPGARRGGRGGVSDGPIGEPSPDHSASPVGKGTGMSLPHSIQAPSSFSTSS